MRTRFAIYLLALPLAAQQGGAELGFYGGLQHWELWRSKFSSKPGSELATGGVWGARLGADITRRFGLELGYGYGVNNLRLFPDERPRAGNVRSPLDVGFGARNHHLSLNPVYHFAGSDAKLRPYVTAGLGAHWFRVTDDARRAAQLPTNAYLNAAGLNSKFGPAFNWGGGVKYGFHRLMQLRLDARNVIARNPHFFLPDAAAAPGAAFIAPKGLQSGWQATAGLGFHLGSLGSGASSGGRKTAVADRALTVKLNGDTTDMKLGTSRAFQARTNVPAGTPVTYQWTIKSPTTETIAREVTGPDYTFDSKDRVPGDYKLQVTATSPNYKDPASDTLSFRVLPPDPISLSTAAEPAAIYVGQAANLKAQPGNVPAGTAVRYRWTVNGEPVAGAAGPQYAFDSTGRAPGTYEICATAEADGFSPARSCSTVTVRECTAPTLSLNPPGASEVWRGDRAAITANAQPGVCGGPVNVSYQASEGSITPQGAFDSSNVAFDMANRSRLQRKTVTVTATATDAQGRTASARTSVVVKLAPVAQRLDDVLFAAGSARVNNCGKRVLLEMLAPKLRDDPEAKVLLVGHVDEKEPGAKAKKTRPLDHARVLNAAAVISAGAGICPSLELSRVKVAYAGTKPAAEQRPNFCAASTERRGQAVKQTGRAPFRSIEVWIIPSGAAMPEGVAVEDAPEADIRKLGCPR